jgi:hypothetical protein
LILSFLEIFDALRVAIALGFEVGNFGNERSDKFRLRLDAVGFCIIVEVERTAWIRLVETFCAAKLARQPAFEIALRTGAQISILFTQRHELVINHCGFLALKPDAPIFIPV